MVCLYVFQKLHQIGFSLGEGSEVKVHQPWITTDDGYTSRVTGNLQAVVVTSDMSYPHLASAASLQVLFPKLSLLLLIVEFHIFSPAGCGPAVPTCVECHSKVGHETECI